MRDASHTSERREDSLTHNTIERVSPRFVSYTLRDVVSVQYLTACYKLAPPKHTCMRLRRKRNNKTKNFCFPHVRVLPTAASCTAPEQSLAGRCCAPGSRLAPATQALLCPPYSAQPSGTLTTRCLPEMHGKSQENDLHNRVRKTEEKRV